MQGAISEGIYSSTLTPAFNCSSSCTWPDAYITLGFGSECKDVTAATLSTRKCVGFDGNLTKWNPSDNKSKFCNMTTPSNITLYTRLVATQIQTVLYVSSASLYQKNSFWTLMGPGGDTAFQGPFSPDILRTAQYNTTAIEVQMNAKEEVLECTTSLVAYKYSNVASSGNQLVIGKKEKIRLLPGTGMLTNESTLSLLFNATGLPGFRIGSYQLLAVSEFLQLALFNQSVEYGDEAETRVGVNVPLAQPDGGLVNMLERAAQRMTDRVATGPNMQIALGQTLTNEIFVHVTWHWLVLPIAIEVAAGVLLIITMWRTRSSTGRVLWKYSALALLFHYMKESDNPVEPIGLLQCDVKDQHQLQGLAKSWEVRTA
jgi:hypothetical protein